VTVDVAIDPPTKRAAAVSLVVWPGRYAVVRLEPGAVLPEWADSRPSFLSLTRTADETSVVCDEGSIPAGVSRSGGWSLLAVAGPLEHSLVGVLASLTVALAGAGLPVFAISTFDTDYLLVPCSDLEKCRAALNAAGHDVSELRPQAG
jgi:hypothetical protein